MGYSKNEHDVRVDIWKPSGKWYTTLQLVWDPQKYYYEDELIHETFRRCMAEQYPGKFLGMTATCLEPYHKHSHPIMIKL